MDSFGKDYYKKPNKKSNISYINDCTIYICRFKGSLESKTLLKRFIFCLTHVLFSETVTDIDMNFGGMVETEFRHQL